MVHIRKENIGESFFIKKPMIFQCSLFFNIKQFLLCFNVLSLDSATLVIRNGFCHWRSAFRNDLAFDYHMIIRMVIILKWNPSQSKAIGNCQVCSGNYISCLLLF